MGEGREKTRGILVCLHSLTHLLTCFDRLAHAFCLISTVSLLVDVSTPMHHKRITDNYDYLPHNRDPSLPTPDRYKDMVIQPLGDRQAFYDDMIGKCVAYYGKHGHRCLEYESDRVEMTLRQPQSMENYTDLGFKKIRAPDNVWKLIKTFWDRNKDNHDKENWPSGNTYSKCCMFDGCGWV